MTKVYMGLVLIIIASVTSGIEIKSENYKMAIVNIVFAIYFAIVVVGAITNMC